MECKMKHLDLFTGIGGFSLAAQWAGFETVAMCEIDNHARNELKRLFPEVPIHEDIRGLNGNEYSNVTLITGGYPCQPFSSIGKRKGKEDSRHVWPEMFRVIKQARPTYVVAENVARHVTMGLDSVCNDLESEGYATRPLIIPACAVGAPHQRDRLWVVAYSKSQREQRIMEKSRCAKKAHEGGRRYANRKPVWIDSRGTDRRWNGGWGNKPRVLPVASRIPGRVDEVRGFGNSIVPQVAFEILNAISKFETIA